jgi:hypothetical protein
MAHLIGKPKHIKELMNMDFPDYIWTVEDLFPEGGLAIISGQPGHFKSWVILDIAVAVSGETKLFGHFDTKQSNVLVIDEENGERLLQKRLKKVGINKDLPIFYYSNETFTVSDASIEALLGRCKEFNIGTLIIDSLVRIHKGDENSSGDMSQIFNKLRRITAKGITVILIHHNKKPGIAGTGGAHDLRGSSDILASLDTHITLSRRDKELMFTQTKRRYAEEIKPFKVNIVENEGLLVMEYAGGAEDKDHQLQDLICTIVRDQPKMNQVQILKALVSRQAKVNEHKLRKTLKIMTKGGLLDELPGPRNSSLYDISGVNNE